MQHPQIAAAEPGRIQSVEDPKRSLPHASASPLADRITPSHNHPALAGGRLPLENVATSYELIVVEARRVIVLRPVAGTFRGTGTVIEQWMGLSRFACLLLLSR